MSEESDALLHIADDHPCCKLTLLWAHNRFLELERENAALRAWKESALAVQAEMDEQAIAKMLGGQLGRSCRKIIAERVPELIAECAKLREDKARLDHMEAMQGVWPVYHDGEWHTSSGMHHSLRAAIDAARKEAQP